MGAGTGPNIADAGARAATTTRALTRLLAGRGLPFSDENFFGAHSTATAGLGGVTGYDPRLAFSGSGMTRTTVRSLGGELFQSTAAGDTITFTPATPVNTCDVYVVGGSASGTYTISDAGGTKATKVGASGEGFYKLSVPLTTLGTGAITLTHTVAGTLYIAGMDCYNSGSPTARIINLGVTGSATEPFTRTANVFDPGSALATLAPDLTVIQLGINDVRTAVAAATWQASMQALITIAKQSGDVMLVWHWPDTGSGLDQALTADYRAALYALARTNSLPLLDLAVRTMPAAGYYDFVHLNAVGYYDVALAHLPLLVG